MKTLRYLLIVMIVSVASMVFATAQNLAQLPQIQMHTTSIMAGSGSTLPSAAVQGTYVTGTTIGTYSPTNASGPHRAKRGADEGEGDTPPSDPHGAMEDPLGDAVLPLMLFACAYFIWRATRKRRVKTLNG